MGPFAGVGDTIFGVLIPTIFGSIAAYMGQNGNVTGVVIWLLVNIAILIFRYFTTGIGYREGTKLVTSAKDKLDALTHAATLLGITVVGCLLYTSGFERIVMLLLERGYQVPSSRDKKAFLIEKNMPQEGMLKVLNLAKAERAAGRQVMIANMKKNKKFQKEQLTEQGYGDIVECYRDSIDTL